MKKLREGFIIGFLLTALFVILLVGNGQSIIGWSFVCLFGSITILILLKIISPNVSWLRWLKIPRERDNRPFNEIYSDNGIFDYQDNCFKINLEDGQQEIKWTEIKTIFGYKIDLFSIDSICVDVFCDNDKFFTIREETKGWFQFIEQSKNRFPSIDKVWEIKIAVPAFETNLTLVYDRENRNIGEVKEECYERLTKNGSR